MKKFLTMLLAVPLLFGVVMSTPVGTVAGDNDTIKLYAGQNMEVGWVDVDNDGTNLYVTYHITKEGWCMTESHLHVGTSSEDFPMAGGKIKNVVPGQFEYKMNHNPCVTQYPYTIPLDGDWEDNLTIAAHAVVEKPEVCEVIQAAEYGATEVVNYDQGLRYDYKPVRSQRSNPDAVLSFTTGQNEANFFSLGFQEDRAEHEGVDDAWIIVKFDNPILNGAGHDIRVVEDTWGLPYPDETAAVWASQNGDDWSYLGEADNQTPYMSIHTISDFDLGSVGLDWARYVKVQDTSNRADFASRYPSQGATLDGFDVNAILSLQDYVECSEPQKETAWAATAPGETRFTTKGNWATWFTYTLKSVMNWVEVDELVVYPNGQDYPSEALECGKTYKVEVSGKYYYNHAGDWADAEWYLKNGEIVKGDTEGSKPYVLDLSIRELGTEYNIDWGDYSPENTYSKEISLTCPNEKLTFFIYDSNYSDNSGSLNVTVYEWK
jgi:hypothetical protein